MLARHRWLVLVVLAAMLLAACGSSGGDKSAAPSTDDVPSSQDAASDEPEPSEGGSGGQDLPEVADGIFTNGSMSVEIRGDRSEDFDLVATAFITGGLVFVSGVEDTNTAAAQLTWSASEGAGGLSVTLTNLLSAADMTTCDLELSKNDPTGLAGTLDCDDIDGLENGITGKKLDVRIEFSVTP